MSKANHIVFRNPMQEKIWYLQRRPDQPKSEASYILGPNQTVEALDEAEEMLLASMGLVDITKESPAIANNIDSLKSEVAVERVKNADLLAQIEALKAEKTDKVDTAQFSKKR